jgi:hypothetical protein
MFSLFQKIRRITCCVALSILLHIVFMSVLKMFGTYDFGAPVDRPQCVMVDLASPVQAASEPGDPVKPDDAADPTGKAAKTVETPPLAPSPPESAPAAHPEESGPGPKAPEPPAADAQDVPPAAQGDREAKANPPSPITQQANARQAEPSSAGARLPSAQYEKLSYQISMFGVSIGSAELESKNEGLVNTITLRVRSNAATSGFFPVDDLVETRRIDGMYNVTKLRQQEGSFRSDEMFTINLLKKSVSWNDFLNGRTLKMALPSGDVLDTLSGIYHLRNLPLQVGRTETLHIYDSETCAEVPVEILRREEMRLPNLTKIATLVVRPLQKTAGIFRRTGEVLIWLTDDDHKVPVKIVTSIALGRVTAELVSSETRPHHEGGKGARAD